MNPNKIENSWDKTTTDSILFIAKKRDAVDQINNAKNKIVILPKKYFFKGNPFISNKKSDIVFKMFR